MSDTVPATNRSSDSDLEYTEELSAFADNAEYNTLLVGISESLFVRDVVIEYPELLIAEEPLPKTK